MKGLHVPVDLAGLFILLVLAQAVQQQVEEDFVQFEAGVILELEVERIGLERLFAAAEAFEVGGVGNDVRFVAILL